MSRTDQESSELEKQYFFSHFYANLSQARGLCAGFDSHVVTDVANNASQVFVSQGFTRTEPVLTKTTKTTLSPTEVIC